MDFGEYLIEVHIIEIDINIIYAIYHIRVISQ